MSLAHGISEGTRIQLFLLRDTDVMNQGEFDGELEEIRSYKDDVEWTGPEHLVKRIMSFNPSPCYNITYFSTQVISISTSGGFSIEQDPFLDLDSSFSRTPFLKCNGLAPP